MKNYPLIAMVGAGLLALIATTGCRTDYGAGNPYQPGATSGKVVGAGGAVTWDVPVQPGGTMASKYIEQLTALGKALAK